MSHLNWKSISQFHVPCFASTFNSLHLKWKTCIQSWPPQKKHCRESPECLCDVLQRAACLPSALSVLMHPSTDLSSAPTVYLSWPEKFAGTPSTCYWAWYHSGCLPAACLSVFVQGFKKKKEKKKDRSKAGRTNLSRRRAKSETVEETTEFTLKWRRLNFYLVRAHRFLAKWGR